MKNHTTKEIENKAEKNIIELDEPLVKSTESITNSFESAFIEMKNDNEKNRKQLVLIMIILIVIGILNLVVTFSK